MMMMMMIIIIIIIIMYFDVFPTVHHSIGYFLEPTLMHTSI